MVHSRLRSQESRTPDGMIASTSAPSCHLNSGDGRLSRALRSADPPSIFLSPPVQSRQSYCTPIQGLSGHLGKFSSSTWIRESGADLFHPEIPIKPISMILCCVPVQFFLFEIDRVICDQAFSMLSVSSITVECNDRLRIVVWTMNHIYHT